MALRKIVYDGDPLLRKQSREVTDISARIRTLIEDMWETLYEANGVGLAAPQVGVLRRVIVIDTTPPPDDSDEDEADADGADDADRVDEAGADRAKDAGADRVDETGADGAEDADAEGADEIDETDEIGENFGADGQRGKSAAADSEVSVVIDDADDIVIPAFFPPTSVGNGKTDSVGREATGGVGEAHVAAAGISDDTVGEAEAPPIPQKYVLINPELVWVSEEMQCSKEGCLSVPGRIATVTRPEKVRVKALDEEGRPVEIEADGLLAKALQHEIDHLNGIVIVDISDEIEDVRTESE
jgi:peptide deformylase